MCRLFRRSGHFDECCRRVLHSHHNFGGFRAVGTATWNRKSRHWRHASGQRVLRINLPVKIRRGRLAAARTKKAAAMDAAAFRKLVPAGDRLVAGRRRWTNWTPMTGSTAPRGSPARRRRGLRLRRRHRGLGAWERRAWQPPSFSSPGSSWRPSSARPPLTFLAAFLADFFARLLGSLLGGFLRRFLGGLLRRLLGGLLLRHYGLLGLFSLLALLTLLRFSHRDPPVAAVHVCRALRIVRGPDRDDTSSKRPPAPSLGPGMISGQTLRVCPEETGCRSAIHMRGRRSGSCPRADRSIQSWPIDPGFGPPVAQSRSSIVCTTGTDVPPAI